MVEHYSNKSLIADKRETPLLRKREQVSKGKLSGRDAIPTWSLKYSRQLFFHKELPIVRLLSFTDIPSALFVAAAVLAPVKGRIEGIEIATVQFILDNAERFAEISNLSKWLPGQYLSGVQEF